MNRPHPSALCFDYGNTLIAFGPQQQEAQLEAMLGTLEAAGHEVDLEKLNALRIEQIMRPYHSGGVENDWEEVCREVVELSQTPPDPALVQGIMRARQEAFYSAVSVTPEVHTLLQEFHGTYRLALLSNYPCRDSIVGSLERLGLLGFFETVVISGEVGYAKPHPVPYEVLLKRLDLPAEECVYIGDNWLADIQGAGRQGMRTVWIREHIPYETFEPQEGDLPATAELQRLAELPALLDTW